MASQQHAHRSTVVAVSSGFALAVPLVAYAATLPFEAAHDAVRTAGLPFALGAFAGMGAYALTSAYYEAKDGAAAEKSEQEAQPEPRVAEKDQLGVTGIFRRREDDSVPVISRAVDALSEAEAWAEIDRLLEEDSPVSCDAATSKDIYQIALEELARAAGSAPSSDSDVDPSAGVTNPVALMESGSPTSAMDRAAVDAAIEAQRTMQLDAEELAMAQMTAQLACDAIDLDEPSGVFPASSVEDAAAVPSDALPSDQACDRKDAAEDASTLDAASALASAAEELAVRAANGGPIDGDDAVQEVVMVDYSGHEAMWAAAIAILEEDLPPLSADAHRAGAASDLGAASSGAGGGAASARKAGREYLSVIEGGTASMPALKVEP